MSYKPFFNRHITATLAVPFLFIFAPDFISARGAEVAQTRSFSVSRSGVESSPLVVVGGEGLTGTSFSPFDPALGTLTSFTIHWNTVLSTSGTVGPDSSGGFNAQIGGNFSVNSTNYDGTGNGGGMGGGPGSLIGPVTLPTSNSRTFLVSGAGSAYDPALLTAVTSTSDFTLSYRENSSANLATVSPSGLSSLSSSLTGSVTLTYTYTPPISNVVAGSVIGGRLSASTFTVGSLGSNWFSGETPDKAFDGSANTKYLNLVTTNAGLIFSPQRGVAQGVPTHLSLWTANDFVGRDPASYQLYGSPTQLNGSTPGTTYSTSGMTLIGSGSLSLPSTRLSGPTQVALPSHATSYPSYLLVFPNIKDGGTNSTQIGEVVLGFGSSFPPQGVDQEITLSAGETYTFSSSDWGFSDPFDSPANTFSAVRLTSLPSVGSLKVDDIPATAGQDVLLTSVITYTPPYASSSSFTFQVIDNGIVGNRDLSPNTVSFEVSGPVIATSPSGFANFSTNGGTPSAAQSITVSGTRLAEAIVVSAPTGYEVSLDNITFTPIATLAASSGSVSATLYVRISKDALGGAVAGNLTLTSSKTETAVISLSGTVVPVLAASSESLSGFEAPLGAFSASQTVEISGGGFPSPVTVTAPAGFEVSENGTDFSANLALSDLKVGSIQGMGDAGYRWWGTESGTLITNRYAFAAIHWDGSVTSWGDPQRGGDSSGVADKLSSGVTRIFPSQNSFAALKSDGSVVTWGDSYWGAADSSGVSAKLSSGVVNVSSGRSAFAALKSDGSVVTWGWDVRGGDSSSVAAKLSSGVKEVSSAWDAFAALKSDGSVVTWGGVAESGGDSSKVAASLRSGVTKVYANAFAFAALKENGSVVTWGSWADGGDSASVAGKLSSGVKQIHSNGSAFVAVKLDGSAVTWGWPAAGGDSSSVADKLASGVKAVYAGGSGAFAALKEDGSVVTWGDSDYGGDSSSVANNLSSGVTEVFANERAFAALKSDGSLVTWGEALYGGDSSSVASLLASGVEKVFSTAEAFAALKSDGTVVTWGQSGRGGDSSAVQAQLNQVIAVHSTERAFAAVKADGTVVTWGAPDNGGASGPLNLAGPVAPTLPRTLHVRLAATAPKGAISGELTLSTAGVATQSIALSGTVTTTLIPSVQSLAGFSAPVGSPSSSKSFTVGATGAPSLVTVAAPAGYEVSLDHVNFSSSLTLGKPAGFIENVYSGDFKEYTTASGNIWASGSGQEFPNWHAFAAIKSDGSVVTWGLADHGGNSGSVAAKLSSGVTAVYSNEQSFAALKGDGSVVTWGVSTLGGNSSGVAGSLQADVKEVYSTKFAFAALKNNGSVVTWGSSTNGANSSSVAGQLVSGVTAITSTERAFAALKSDGSVVTWGNAGFGGDSTGVAGMLSTGVTKIYSNKYVFAALKSDGSVVTWGDSTYGGNSASVAGGLSSGVTDVYSNEIAFAAVKSDGSVVTWGYSSGGGDSSGVAEKLSSGVTRVYSSPYAFAALKSDGSVVTWGSTSVPSTVATALASDVTAVCSSLFAFAALKSDGSVVTWGDSGFGGNSSSVAGKLSSGVTAIYSGPKAFAAVKSDGSVVTWGDAASGGDSSSVADQLISGVTALSSNTSAFAAVKSDGSVVTWGNTDWGGSGGPANIGAAVPPTLPVTIYVRLSANAQVGDVSGNITLSSSGFANQPIALSGTVGGETPLTPFQAWRQQHYGNPESTGNGADLALPDGDGIANLIKYGICITPGTDGSRALPELFRSADNRLALRFLRDPSRNDVDLIVEAQSNALDGTWTEISRSSGGAAFTGNAQSNEISNSNGTRTVEVKDTLVIDPSVPKRFLRVRVEADSGAGIEG
ncbi:MAG: hypothetical protein RLZZ245_1381 [Verrucomicrobiota bacterium]